MAKQSTVIAAVRLARDPRRLLERPGLAIVAGIGGATTSRLVEGPLGIALGVAGLLVAVAGVYLAAWLFSFRLEAEAGVLRIRWLGGERRYQLVRGQLTRVVIRGGGAAALRPRLGILGMGLGPAVLRGEERIEILRLAHLDSMILVPTDRGRLAIAAAVEQELLDALAAAVRRQQELDAIQRTAAQASPPPASSAQVAFGSPAAGIAPTRFLTGIERALLEERHAAEQAAALAVAEAEERGAFEAGMAGRATTIGADPVTAAATVAPRTARQRTRTQWQRPSWLALPVWMTLSPRLLEVLPIVVPLIVAAGAWVAATVQGRMNVPYPEARYLILALVLTGPLAALAALVTRSWQPRLAALVSVSALAAQVLLARALIV